MTFRVYDWRRQVAALYQTVRACADPEQGHVLWCRGRQRLFGQHSESPRRGVVLQHAAYNPQLRFVAAVDHAPGDRIEIPTATDGVVPFQRLGTVNLEGIGTLDVWWLNSYGGGIWLPIRDASPLTYGGGRYVLDTVKGADLGGDREGLVVDLNFAYNPSCAYDEKWACPLAPPGNVVDVPVEVGELLPEPAAS